MSISSQPFTRQASLQRGRPSILPPYDAVCDTKDTQTGLMQHHIDPDPLRVKPCMRPKSAPPRDCQSNAAVLAKQDAAAVAAKHFATGTWQPQQCISSKNESLSKQAYGLLPALASKLAGRLQHKKEELQNLTRSCSSPLIAAQQSSSVSYFGTSAKHKTDDHLQSKLHPSPASTSKASDAFADAMADAAQLTADLAAFRNGQDVGKDKDQLAAAAKETANKLQEVAQTQLLQTFSDALRHMSQETLISQVMTQLQLPPLSPQAQQAAALTLLISSQLRVKAPRLRAEAPQLSAQQPQTSAAGQQLDSRAPSMADPIAMPHPKKRRSQRKTRPASAGVPGLQSRFSICARQSGYPLDSSDEDQGPARQQEAAEQGCILQSCSQGDGMQASMEQKGWDQTSVSKQEWAQLDWSNQLPASTSALLQAVEMAAAAERPMRVCPVTGKKVMRRPRSALARPSSACDPTSTCMPAASGRTHGPVARQDSEYQQLAAAEQLARLSQATVGLHGSFERNHVTDTAEPSGSVESATDVAAVLSASSEWQPAMQSMPASLCQATSAASALDIPRQAAAPLHQQMPMHCNVPEAAHVVPSLPSSLTASSQHPGSTAGHGTHPAATTSLSQRPISTCGDARGAAFLAGLPSALAPSSLVRPAGSSGLRQSMWQHLHSHPPNTAASLQSPFAAAATHPFSHQAAPTTLPLHSDAGAYTRVQAQGVTAQLQYQSHPPAPIASLQPSPDSRHAAARATQHAAGSQASPPHLHVAASQPASQDSTPGQVQCHKSQPAQLMLPVHPSAAIFATSLARPQGAGAAAEVPVGQASDSTAAQMACTAQAKPRPHSASARVAACNASMQACSTGHAQPAHVEGSAACVSSIGPVAASSTQMQNVDAPSAAGPQINDCVQQADALRLVTDPRQQQNCDVLRMVQSLGGGTTGAASSKKRSHAVMQSTSGDTSQDLSINELLPGRNIILDAGQKDDLTFQLMANRWCWVARIDKVTATHTKVSWYGRHNSRCTLARHASGPDEGQVRSGDLDLMQHKPLAVFDRFSGNKEVPSHVYTLAIAKLSMQAAHKQSDQEPPTCC